MDLTGMIGTQTQSTCLVLTRCNDLATAAVRMLVPPKKLFCLNFNKEFNFS